MARLTGRHTVIAGPVRRQLGPHSPLGLAWKRKTSE